MFHNVAEAGKIAIRVLAFLLPIHLLVGFLMTKKGEFISCCLLTPH